VGGDLPSRKKVGRRIVDLSCGVVEVGNRERVKPAEPES
jgi:hypothetical protein